MVNNMGLDTAFGANDKTNLGPNSILLMFMEYLQGNKPSVVSSISKNGKS